MNEGTQHRHDHLFWIGLLAGTAVGAGLAMWLTPGATGELRQRASAGVGEAVDEFTQKSQGLRHDVARVIVRGAHEAERVATVIEGTGPIAAVKS